MARSLKKGTLRRVVSSGEDRQDEQLGRKETNQNLVAALDE